MLRRAASFRSTVFRLAVAQALYLGGTAIAFAFSGIIGGRLAPDPSLSTLPAALMTVATMLTTIPASLLMGRFGRRIGFVAGAAAGSVGAGVAAWGIAQGSFALFCAGNALLGTYQAFAMYYRFAAAEAADERGKGAQAVGWVLTGGIAAALLGPSIGAWSRTAIPTVEFAGSYLAAVPLSLLALGVVATLALAPPSASVTAGARRPLGLIARQPVFIAAVVNAVVAYAVMSFVMTASPLAIVAAGHGVDAAASLTRWHLLGMFAPSFVTGKLVARIGPVSVLLAGGAVVLASLFGALAGNSALHFNAALLVLGVGWNLLYVAATALLTQSYWPAERARVQGLNEFLVFGGTAAASLAAGAVQTKLGWEIVTQSAAPLVILAMGVTSWAALHGRKRPAEALDADRQQSS
ncbi:MFS transporter [Edaphosphingomonas haloaromaticamans]|uniref:Major Facilitator Superfamily protein n=1 Tax=Edaphosphingomonas haloaromaticamans TaxID=653954 RepID=A0A1S1H9U0_9SPHN|nr:MFS transporter [Sphingomonas haloaromaticamans]OHT18845.1 Major Facilitator Superfamily protein [Sphingomonas haloaromaticamans]